MGSIETPQVCELDALIIGGGFNGVYGLKKLRDAGYKVKLVEHGSDYGGTWYWNRYPGARVDSTVPHYEFSDPDLWKDWTWKKRFPDSPEIRAYFAHVAEKWDLRKDTQFGTYVSSATWDDSIARWIIKTESGETYSAKFFLLCTGISAKRYLPDWKGMGSFKGPFIHPSRWPHEELDLKGKRVAIIGTGATGVQLAQELAKTVSQLTVFQRTPNLCTPMSQDVYNLPEQAIPRPDYADFFNGRGRHFTGFNFDFLARATFDDTPEQRQKQYEELWAKGDFRFWLGSYHDMLFSKEANVEAYNFWRDKTRARIHDEKVADLLAPMEPPHAFGCKRISLEINYYEVFNEPHVTLVDMSSKGTPIQEITEKGIKTTEKEHEFDVIICATGYDAMTGGLTQIDIRGPSGESIREHWKDGVKSYLGLAVSGFPNLFFTYGPQAPTAFCNAPTCVELQGNWILQTMEYMKKRGLRKIEAQKKGEDEWREEVFKLANATLLPSADSWLMGANIPGKTREPLLYVGGVPAYHDTLVEVAANGYDGFDLS